MSRLKMKTVYKSLLLLIFLSCGALSQDNIQKDTLDIPQQVRKPIGEYAATVKLNEPIMGIDGNMYVLEKYKNMGDSLFILRLFVFEKD